MAGPASPPPDIPTRAAGRPLTSRRLALLAHAAQHGIVEHLGFDPAAKIYTVRVRGEVRHIPGKDLEPWLIGVADAHGVGDAFRVP